MTFVKIATDKAPLKSVRNCGRFCDDHSLQTMVITTFTAFPASSDREENLKDRLNVYLPWSAINHKVDFVSHKYRHLGLKRGGNRSIMSGSE